jgi:hypothetical protein
MFCLTLASDKGTRLESGVLFGNYINYLNWCCEKLLTDKQQNLEIAILIKPDNKGFEDISSNAEKKIDLVKTCTACLESAILPHSYYIILE